MPKYLKHRELVAEWWELWWKKQDHRSVMVRAEWHASHPLIPSGCFATKATALARKDHEANQHHVVVHVTRYRRFKK